MNLYKSIHGHLLGEHRSPHHKFLMGILIIAFGVCMANFGKTLDSVVIHYTAEGVGYLIHSVGGLPILKSIEEYGKKGGAL